MGKSKTASKKNRRQRWGGRGVTYGGACAQEVRSVFYRKPIFFRIAMHLQFRLGVVC